MNASVRIIYEVNGEAEHLKFNIATGERLN